MSLKRLERSNVNTNDTANKMLSSVLENGRVWNTNMTQLEPRTIHSCSIRIAFETKVFVVDDDVDDGDVVGDDVDDVDDDVVDDTNVEAAVAAGGICGLLHDARAEARGPLGEAVGELRDPSDIAIVLDVGIVVALSWIRKSLTMAQSITSDMAAIHNRGTANKSMEYTEGEILPSNHSIG